MDECADELSSFRRDRLPALLVILAVFTLFGGWVLIPPLVLGFATAWPIRSRLARIGRAQKRWEQQLAFSVGGVLLSCAYAPIYFLLLGRYVF